MDKIGTHYDPNASLNIDIKKKKFCHVLKIPKFKKEQAISPGILKDYGYNEPPLETSDCYVYFVFWIDIDNVLDHLQKEEISFSISG